MNDLCGKGGCPSGRACNLAQFCDLGYQLSSLTELLPVTVARGEKAQFLIARVRGSIPDLARLEKDCCLEPPPGCVIHAESIGKLL